MEPYLKLKLFPFKMQWPPFFVFVNNYVKVRWVCDAIQNGLSSLLLSLSPPPKRKCPICNGVKSGLGALSESVQNLSLLERPLSPLFLILPHFLIPTLSSVPLSRSWLLDVANFTLDSAQALPFEWIYNRSFGEFISVWLRKKYIQHVDMYMYFFSLSAS